jgi:hypothetical protein
MKQIWEAFNSLVMNVFAGLRPAARQDHYVLWPGEPDEYQLADTPISSARGTLKAPERKSDALGEYVPEPWWDDEETPVFDGMATEWMLRRDVSVPEEVLELVRVPSGAMDVLARAAERGLRVFERAGQGRSQGGPESGPTSNPRQSGKRSGNPAKRAAALGGSGGNRLT